MSFRINPVKLTQLAIILTAICLLPGCIKEKLLVKLKEDGSGNIVITRIYSKGVTDMMNIQMKKMKEQFTRSGQPMPASMNVNPLFNEKMFEAEASKFGQGVKYVKSKKLKTTSGFGCVILYAFDDINKVKIPVKIMPTPGGMNTDNITFNLAKGKGDNKLTLSLPEFKLNKELAATMKQKPKSGTPIDQKSTAQLQQMKAMGNPFNISDNDTQEVLMSKMLNGLAISIEVETPGTLIKSNAKLQSSKKKNRFTVLDIDFTEMCKSPGFTHELVKAGKQAKAGGPQEMTGIMLSCPTGVKIDGQSKITVEYK